MAKQLTFMNSLHNFVMGLNNSKFFSGLVMILLNVCSKYVTIKLSDSQKTFLNKYDIFRQIMIFAIIWTGTKDPYLSLIMTAVFIVLTEHVFNEESRYCILPRSWTQVEKAMDSNDDGEVSEEEIDNAIKTLNKAKQQKRNQNQELFLKEFMTNRI